MSNRSELTPEELSPLPNEDEDSTDEAVSAMLRGDVSVYMVDSLYITMCGQSKDDKLNRTVFHSYFI